MGIRLSNRLIARVTELEKLVRMTEELIEELQFTLAPPADIMYSVSRRLGNRCPHVLTEYLMIHKQQQGMFPQEWNQSIGSTQPLLSLQDNEVVSSLAEILGASNVQNQVVSLEGTKRLLEDRLLFAKEDSQRHGKLYRTLSTLAGVAILVLFV